MYNYKSEFTGIMITLAHLILFMIQCTTSKFNNTL